MRKWGKPTLDLKHREATKQNTGELQKHRVLLLEDFGWLRIVLEQKQWAWHIDIEPNSDFTKYFGTLIMYIYISLHLT